MIKKFFAICLFISFFILSSCATLYHPPKSNEAAATIRVKNTRQGLATWMHLTVQSIDNRAAGPQLFPSSTRIYPGPHILTVSAEFNRGFFSSGPYEAFVDLKADFKPNQNYLIQANSQGAKILVWLTDSSGRKIAMSTSNYRTAPRSVPVFIPVH